MLLRRFGRVVPRAALEESLYSFNDEVTANAIEIGVYRLRAQLGSAAATVSIRTARGVGYALEEARGADGGSEAAAPTLARPRRRSSPSMLPTTLRGPSVIEAPCPSSFDGRARVGPSPSA